MVEHSFVCDKCNTRIFDTNTKGIHKCPKCKTEDMRWDLCGQSHFRGDYEHISDSLAIHPDDTASHRTMFPKVGVLPDGRLKFTSVKDQERYCNATGFQKQPQRIRSLGRKRIA